MDSRDDRHAAIYSSGQFAPFAFHWLTPHVAYGRNPLSAIDVQELADAGVTHVLDLRRDEEWQPPRHGQDALDAYPDASITRLNLPVIDMTAPTAEDLDRGVAFIDESLASGGRVYVHCRAGLQRTPAVLGCWWAHRHGIGFNDAIEEFRLRGCDFIPNYDQIEAGDAWVAARRDRGELPRSAIVRDRFIACLVAGACGDALGAPVEFVTNAEDRLRQFGPHGIRDYVPCYGRAGAITDDTQMTLFTAEGLLRGHVRAALTGTTHHASIVADAYLRWLLTQGDRPAAGITAAEDGWLFGKRDLHARRAPGNTCLSALRAMRRVGEPARNDSKGCGGVMRTAPVGLFLWRPNGPPRSGEAFRLGVELAALTHGHPTGQLTAGVLSVVILRLVDGAPLPDAVADARSALVAHPHREETLASLDLAVRLAGEATPPDEAIRRIGQGWIAEEALGIAIYCALKAPDLREGVVLAANHDGDTDSTAAIAGNLLGAMQGTAAIPREWVRRLELRRVIEAVAADLFGYREWVLGERAEPARGAAWERYPAGQPRQMPSRAVRGAESDRP